MKDTQKSFSVPASSRKGPALCLHIWFDKRKRCVLCGEKTKHPTTAEHDVVAHQAR